jgi:NADH-quinone oxidoreductase subunit N
MLVGLAVGESGTIATGIASLLFYLVNYGIMTLGVFAVLCAVSSADRPIRTLNDLGGMSRHHPAAAIMLAIMLFSLAGLPPSGGFLGKMNLFLAAWSEGSSMGRYLSYLMAFNAAVSAYYYLRTIAAVYLKPGTGPTTMHMPAPATFAAVLCTVASLAVFIAPQRIWDAAQMKTHHVPLAGVATLTAEPAPAVTTVTKR